MNKENCMNEVTDKTKKVYAIELDTQDLPAYCPHASMQAWSSHPRVYLDLAHTGNATCPYCGTAYCLKPGAIVKKH